MKTDSIFYRLFKELPSTFFDLIGYPATLANVYQFQSVELKQTAFRIDGVFLPQTPTRENPIYFTEVQFQKDPDIYARLFSEIFLYLRTNGSSLPWRAVVVFRSRTIEPNSQAREFYQPLLDSPLVQRIYLNELEVTENDPLGLKILQLIVATKKQILAKVTNLVNQVKQDLRDEKAKQQALDLIETIVLYKLPQLSRQELEAMFSVDDLRKTRFAQEMREEGRAEGELQNKIKTVPRLLALGLSREQVAEVLELTLEQVRQAAQNNEQ